MRKQIGLISLSAILLLTCSLPAGAQDYRIIDRFAGGSNGDGSPGAGATVSPLGNAVDDIGNIYIADSENNRIRVVDIGTGIITTVAGTGERGFSGDGGPAIDAVLNNPVDIDVDRSGNIYIVDQSNQRIRKVNASTGIIETIAGTGVPGFSGDGQGPATQAQIRNPAAVAVDTDGSVFVADTGNRRIRKIFPGSGIETYAGPVGISFIFGLDLDDDGNLYFSDIGTSQIMRIERATRKLTVFAGSNFGLCENVPALEACFQNATDVSYDKVRNALIVADTGNHLIRSVPLDGGIVTNIAGVSKFGTGISGYNGDNQPATPGKSLGTASGSCTPTRWRLYLG